MGAFEVLFIAATGSTNQYCVVTPGRVLRFPEGKQGMKEVRIAPVTNQVPLIQFDRYVAISPPARLTYGVSELGEFFRAPFDWPVAERTDDIENTFLKVVTLSQHNLTSQPTVPFNAIESKFLIGLTFRFTLHDIIYSSQRRDDLGVLHHPISNWRRDPLYQEILQGTDQTPITLQVRVGEPTGFGIVEAALPKRPDGFPARAGFRTLALRNAGCPRSKCRNNFPEPRPTLQSPGRGWQKSAPVGN